MKICRENTYIGYNRTKISGRLRKDISKLYCCRRHKFATKALLCNTQYFYIVDCDTHSSTMLIERIVTFLLQQTLSEHAKMLCYTYSSPQNRPRRPRGGVQV